jgi:Protein of unknown function (DUF4038)/Putative collagen-binding domain of a collagenase
MPVAFDSVGPVGGAGVGGTGSPQTWTHTTIGSNTTILVFAALDGVAPGVTATATLDGSGMTQLGSDVPSGTGGTTGILRVWSASSVASGAHTIVVTCATQNDCTAGSIAFTGWVSFGTVYTNAGSGNGTTAFINVPASTAGNTIVAFCGSGNLITATTTPATARVGYGSVGTGSNYEGPSGEAVGNAACSTQAAGGSVTTTWSTASAVAATFGVELQGATFIYNPAGFVPQLPPTPNFFPGCDVVVCDPSGIPFAIQPYFDPSIYFAPTPSVAGAYSAPTPFQPGPGWFPGADSKVNAPGDIPFSGDPQPGWSVQIPPFPNAGGGGGGEFLPAFLIPPGWFPGSDGLVTSPGQIPFTWLPSYEPVASRTQYIAGVAAGAGGGYFQDQFGTPRMVIGDAPWALCGNAGRWNSGNWQADYNTYLTTRANQGYTIIYTKPMGTTQSGNLDDYGKTFDGLYPFQGGTPSTGVSGANPSSGLTAAFWARIDYFLQAAQNVGITVMLNAIGYNSDFSSGPGPLYGKSTTEFQAYGTALGLRYLGQPNIIWNLADDYFGSSDNLITAFMTGVRGAGDTHAVSIENFPESTSREDVSNAGVLAWGAANAQYNWCYSYNVTYFAVEKAFLESSPIPVIQGDGYFYQGGTTYGATFDRAMRQDAWHAISSGARGAIQGSESIWQWPSTALASSGTDWYYVNNAGKIRALMESLPNWQNLIPDTSSLLVTSGRGTHASTYSSGGGGGQYEIAFTDSYVTASRTAAGDLAVIYLSHGTTITIDQTKMVSGYLAYWADPITGAKTTTSTGSTYNSTAKGNNSQGDPDWVLILQAPAGGSTPIALPDSGAGSETLTSADTVPLAESGAGADTLIIAIPVALADGGAGTEALGIAQATALPDAGAGSETFGAVLAIALADAGTAGEALTVPAGLPDGGSGADALTAVLAVAFPDGGAGSEALAAAVPMGLAESGAGADALAESVPMALAEAGSGADSLAAPAGVALADSGAGADALVGGGTTPVALPDGGAGSETLTGSVTLPLAEAGVGSEALTSAVASGLADAASGADTFLITWAAPLPDSGAGADTLTGAVSIPVSDAGSGADALVGTAAVPLADTGSGTDTFSGGGTAPVALSESGVGTDTLTGAVSVPLADAGTGSEVIALLQPQALADGGTGTEALTGVVAAPLPDAGSGSESFSTGGSGIIGLPDFGAGTDALTGVAAVPVADAGAGADSLAVAIPVALADSGHGTDTFTAVALVALAEAGAALDSLNVPAIGQMFTESGAGADLLVAGFPVPFSDGGHGTDVLHFSFTEDTGTVIATNYLANVVIIYDQLEGSVTITNQLANSVTIENLT